MAGNTSASSLLKSAGGIATQVADYNDKLAALQWNSSAQNEADWQSYSNYLSGRIKTLGTSGTLANASKAVTLTGSLQSANRSFTSNVIQRQSIAILEGNSTAVDKQSAIIDQYQRAVANGDDNLAQNLRQQYDSLNQQIQYNAQTAATAGAALAKANSTAQEQGYQDAADAIKNNLDNFATAYSKEGQANITKNLNSIAKNLGVTLPKGANANNGSLISGAIDAMARLEGMAVDVATATPGGTTSARSYQNKLDAITSGATKFNVGGVSMSLQDAQFYAAHPDAYYQTTTGVDNQGKPQYGLSKAAVNGYTFSPNGDITPIFSKNGDSTTALSTSDDQKKMVADLTNAGFSASVKNGQLVATTSTDGKNAFFQKAINGYGLDKNTQFIVHKTASGYQFLATDQNGTEQLLNLSKDNSGKFGVYNQQFNQGTKGSTYNLIGSFNGYNPLNNDVTNGDAQGGVNFALQKAFANYSGLPKGATEKNIIPNIAKQFFNGDTNAAAKAVYAFRKPLEGNLKSSGINSLPVNTISGSTAFNIGGDLGRLYAEQAMKAQKAGLPPLPSPIKTGPAPASKGPLTVTQAPANKAPLPVAQANPQGTLNVAKANSGGTLSVAGAPSSVINGALSAAFKNYSSQPKFYTENNIIPNIANQYYGGNKTAAASAVYAYRTQNFGS